MSSIGAGKQVDILICFEKDNGKYYCSYKDVSGTFHTQPKARELAKIASIMKKYKCTEINFDKADK